MADLGLRHGTGRGLRTQWWLAICGGSCVAGPRKYPGAKRALAMAALH